jgi:hypothetical protein
VYKQKKKKKKLAEIHIIYSIPTYHVNIHFLIMFLLFVAVGLNIVSKVELQKKKNVLFKVLRSG